jgi:hypothetical protein
VDEATFVRYWLLTLIGQGAMGKVSKARDTMMDRDVAIKVLPTKLATEIEDQLYLVMPVIEGIDVHDLLQRDGPISPQRAAPPAGCPAACRAARRPRVASIARIPQESSMASAAA